MSRQATLLLVTFLALASALHAAPPPPVAAEATEAATAPAALTEADLGVYLAAFPKMSAFMNERGAAFEQKAAAGAASPAASMEAEFEKAVGVPFARFFELHGMVTSAFAEALAARSRAQQKKTLTESIAVLEKAATGEETAAAVKKEMLVQVDEMKLALKSLEQEPAPEPSLSAKTRQLVQARLDEIERVFTEADSPAKVERGAAGSSGTTAPAGH